MSELLNAVLAWESLGDIDVDANDNTLSDWRHFPEGTYYIEMWSWIEEEYGVSIEGDIKPFLKEQGK